MKKHYTQLDKYARVVVEVYESKNVIYLEWNSMPNLNPFDFKYDVHLTKDVLGESMVITDNDMDVYANIEQARKYWEATE